MARKKSITDEMIMEAWEIYKTETISIDDLEKKTNISDLSRRFSKLPGHKAVAKDRGKYLRTLKTSQCKNV